MTNPRHSIADRLLAAQTAISNARTNPEIAERLAAFGYDDAKLAAGQALYDRARELHATQKDEYGDQVAATAAVNNRYEETYSTYIKHIKLARIALKDNTQAAVSLDLYGRRKKNLSTSLDQMDTFYTNLLKHPEYQEPLSPFSITETTLTDLQQKIAQVREAHMTQQQERGEAQESTKIRDEAFDALDDWLSDFFAVARIALEDKAQLLEALGIVVPS